MNDVATAGLRFPTDLEAWSRDQQRRARARRALHTFRSLSRRREAPPAAHLWLPSSEPKALVILDKLTPSCRSALVSPLRYLDASTTAILTPFTDTPGISPVAHHVPWEVGEAIPASVDTVVTLGAYNALAGAVRPWVAKRDLRHIVVQHGLLTPWAPPLVDGDVFLSWSEDDGQFQTAGRATVSYEVCGSQMLWDASRQPSALVTDRPVMLGQLHGIEIPRWEKQVIYEGFCRSTGAEYRPHPNEGDALSKAQHVLMRRRGVRFNDGATGLAELGRPVVSIFSTGTLEAAQHGVPAWVHHPRPHPWLLDFWRRYGLSRWGEEPTPQLDLGMTEPAERVAAVIRGDSRA
ncbi:prephenate dehydrogenase [Acidipropionibacterium timonense]|uniref:prephenate dehydrogenase n=1 Tax=Acidipropionibacterium timonense TaxID=2161818 RepID=UPI0010325361|nr:prephenate dehydrogenase [Acidipropionibacterium timonense]